MKTMKRSCSVPPRACPDCEGEGQHWVEALDSFSDEECRACDGSSYDKSDDDKLRYAIVTTH